MAEDLSKLTIHNILAAGSTDKYRVSSATDAAFKRVLSLVNTLTEEHKTFVKAYSKNEESGYTERAVFIPSSLVEQLENKLKSYIKETETLKGEGSFPLEYDIQSVKTLQGTLNLMGAQAQSKAVLKARELGGTYDKATGAVAIPLDPAKYKSITRGGTSAAYISKEFSDAVQISKNLEDEKKQILAERQAVKEQKEYEKQEAKSRKLSAWFRKEGESAAAKEYQKKLDASKSGGEGEDENKRENFLTSFLKDPLVKMLGFFGITVSLLRRILEGLTTRAIEKSRESVKIDTQIQEIGLTRRQMRDFGIFETAHGLTEGTVAGAVREVQSYKRIDKLSQNPKMTEYMALLANAAGVDSSKFVSDLATMELTQAQPDEMLARIMNVAAKAYDNRVDILTGQKTDASSALFSIVNRLEEIGLENTADLFRQYVADKESGIWKGSFADWKGWLGTTRTNTTGLSDASLDAFRALGQVFNSLAAKIKDITDSVLVRFALSLSKVVDWLNNQRWFMSDAEKAYQNRLAMQKNEAKEGYYSSLYATSKEDFEKGYYELTGQKYAGNYNALSKEDRALIFEKNPDLLVKWVHAAHYQKKLAQVREQLEAGYAGKDVFYYDYDNSVEANRLQRENMLEQQLKLRGTEATTKAGQQVYAKSSSFMSVPTGKKSSLTEADKEYNRKLVEQIQAMSKVNFMNMSWKQLENNPLANAFLEAYKERTGMNINENNWEGFISTGITAKSKLQSAWDALSKDTGLSIDFIQKAQNVPLVRTSQGALNEAWFNALRKKDLDYSLYQEFIESGARAEFEKKGEIVGHYVRPDASGRKQVLMIQLKDAKGNVRDIAGYETTGTWDSLQNSASMISIDAEGGVIK